MEDNNGAKFLGFATINCVIVNTHKLAVTSIIKEYDILKVKSSDFVPLNIGVMLSWV